MRILLVVRSVLFATLALVAPAVAQHLQAVTDCNHCHDDPAQGRTDMWVIHDYSCWFCHPDYNFTRTILGRIGTWNHECTMCHQESNTVTGNLSTATKGHRCTVCHDQQMPVTSPQEFHHAHAEKVNCVVCHGQEPDAGTVIGSGNRQVCAVCHTDTSTASVRTLHREMTPHGLNCLECHGGVRPPVDVVPGPPVGNTTVVCDVCHTGLSPALFLTRGAELHKTHLENKLECGSCHLDANLQDDRRVMPPYDDARRSLLNRSGTNECAHCHGGTPVATTTAVHSIHASQWCYNCHEGTDMRPLGQAPPVTTPREACTLCHTASSYAATFPFDVHEHHAEKLKCFTCHQGTPPVGDWPFRWRRTPGVLATYGTGCAGLGTPPVLGMTGNAGLGHTFQVTLGGAPAQTVAALVIGFQGESMDMEGYGMRGCLLLVDFQTSWVTVSGSAGTATFVQAVPTVRDLVGVALYFQWFVPDANASELGLATSNGGRATVGR